MSVTIADLLKLPSLRNARVIAGKEGLDRIVTSVSVLEYADPAALLDELFNNNEFFGSEIVITSFANIRDNVEAQCANILRLNEVGEVGLILYYVGYLMERVDPKLIALADQLGFTLICMPEGRMDLRYSEAIGDITEAIYRDQASHAALTSELLERISRLPVHQRTVDTIFKMLSDRLHLSLILTSENGAVLNAISWPRTDLDDLIQALPGLALPAPDTEPRLLPLLGGTWLSHLRITAGERPMNLLVFDSAEEKPEATTLSQIRETVQLAVNLWSSNHDQVAATELVRAILQDEPLKMRRLAEIFHIDVAAIHSMWILHTEHPREAMLLSSAIRPLRELIRQYASVVLCDLYENELLLFTDGPSTLSDRREFLDALDELLSDLRIPALVTCCHPLANTTQVRNAFLANQEHLALARRIYPDRRHYTLDEILFAADCDRLLKEGEQAISRATSVLFPLQSVKDGAELLHTMEIFLLDCESSVTQTARVLFVHPNTIKHRIRRLSDLLGRRIDQMPAAMSFYQAAALRRILNQ